eukprot:Seg2085.8 transcript_id=Seg2085.8/GoldUCD/mRNA.D3Y31 product="Proton-coupled folate transporter" protein_id=Seg2085.8/GoldUCD/D3Y31
MAKDQEYRGVRMSEAVVVPRNKLQSIKHHLRHVTIEPVVFLCVASAVFKFVFLPQFLLETICHRDYNSSICNRLHLPEYSTARNQVQSTTAKWMLGLYSCSLLISLFTVPIIGTLADTIGKKRALFIPVVIFNLQSIVYVILSWNSTKINPQHFFLCSTLGGLSGDIVALMMLACSYLSDITTEKERTFRLTLLEGTLTCSLCVFTFVSGFVIVAFGYSRAFFFSFGADTIAFVFLVAYVSEDKANHPRVVEEKDAKEPFDVSKSLEKEKELVNHNENGTINETSCEINGGNHSLKDRNQPIEECISADDQPIRNGTDCDHRNDNDYDHRINDFLHASTDIDQSLADGSDSVVFDTSRRQNAEHKESSSDSENNAETSSLACEISLGKMNPNKDDDLKSIGVEGEIPALQGKQELNDEPEMINLTFKNLIVECNPLKRFQVLARVLKEQGDMRSILMLLIVLCTSTMSIIGESLIMVLYIRNHPFNMQPIDVGYLLSLQGLLRFVVGCLFVNMLVQRFFKWKDINTVIVALSLSVGYFILLGTAHSRGMLYGIQIMSIFGPLANPTLRSIISKKGNPQNYATILSVALTIDTVASFAVNLIVHATYANMVKSYPGAFCFILAGISGIGIVMSFIVRHHEKINDSNT